MHLPRDHTSQYTALVPAQPLDQVNPPRTRAALEAVRVRWAVPAHRRTAGSDWRLE